MASARSHAWEESPPGLHPRIEETSGTAFAVTIRITVEGNTSMKHSQLLSLMCWMTLLLATWGGAAHASASEPVPQLDLPTDKCATRDDCKVIGPECPWPDGLSASCPTGTCDPDGNARGIYIEIERSYCLKKDSPWLFDLCPEAFINRYDSSQNPTGVDLLLRDTTPGRLTDRAALSASIVNASGEETPVQLLRVKGDKTRLAIEYALPCEPPPCPTPPCPAPPCPTVLTAEGRDLEALRLRFSFTRARYRHAPTMYQYEMKMTGPHGLTLTSPRFPGAPTPKPLKQPYRYTMAYRPVGSNAAWTPHCQQDDGTSQVSFLVGKYVSGVTAQVQDKPEMTTMSCVSGAIDSCIDWGYAPWSTKTISREASEYLFQACLQAKRAAYFVGRGDLTSYTVNGTKIFLRDSFGINKDVIGKLEAIWGPRGVECINPEYRRRRDICIREDLLAQVPLCRPEHWNQKVRLATGPDSLTPTVCPAVRPPIEPGTATTPLRSGTTRTP